MASKAKNGTKSVQPRLRILRRSDIAIGPGKAYMRAWKLIQTMNACFKEPAVLTVRGGQSGGGAELSETGRKALELYMQMEQASLEAIEKSWKGLQPMLCD